MTNSTIIYPTSTNSYVSQHLYFVYRQNMYVILLTPLQKFHIFFTLLFIAVYTDQPVSSKSPPTRDKIYPETKAQVRLRNRNRQIESEPGKFQVQLYRKKKIKVCPFYLSFRCNGQQCRAQT